jgi:hypothetical protein
MQKSSWENTVFAPKDLSVVQTPPLITVSVFGQADLGSFYHSWEQVPPTEGVQALLRCSIWVLSTR